MRPLELTVDGFRSYRTPQTFDLRGRRLVGIVGEIGAGKSSILDAIAFALYGKTPTIGRETKSLIHQLRDDCHVQLRFRVDGQVYWLGTATRGGSSPVAAARLDVTSGRLERAALSTEQLAEAEPVAWTGRSGWRDCECGERSR